MLLEQVIEISVWIIATLLLYWLVPRDKLHEAMISFLFMQVPSWLLGFAVVELHLIEYPVRFFATASKSSFTYEYYALPVLSVLYTLYFPKRKAAWVKLLYALSFTLVLTLIEVILERYTLCIHYIHWTWYLSWFTLLLVLHISYRYTIWFMRTVRSSR